MNMIKETDPSKEVTSRLKCALLESVCTAEFQGSTPKRRKDNLCRLFIKKLEVRIRINMI